MKLKLSSNYFYVYSIEFKYKEVQLKWCVVIGNAITSVFIKSFDKGILIVF